ncbi:putative uncharacterized protein [Blautia hydrogenotrophica CAG:147]|uniref:CYTH domain-containing protein n=1 Tax=Blautia hydrogenotrophica TaxID=53443 RepID=UPI00033A9D63|nr:CYTH domain-containing protein [Blautia hydrogenotrophica]CCX59193.1 putative uncharacterized protein [Blautia hydrogenotrophica CAG:147]
MEIERKFLIGELPESLLSHCTDTIKLDFPFHEIEQGYLCTKPVVRIRRQDDSYFLTYKSKGFMSREEYNLPLTKEAYEHLRTKTDGVYIKKTRYIIPADMGLQIELDIFHGAHKGLMLAEVEFPDEQTALNYQPPVWLGEEVTFSEKFHNSYLSQHPFISA